MCRGSNGRHVQVAPGVSYCPSGETLHVAVDDFYHGTGLAIEPYTRHEIAWAVSTAILRLAAGYPAVSIRKVSIKGIDGNERRTF